MGKFLCRKLQVETLSIFNEVLKDVCFKAV